MLYAVLDAADTAAAYEVAEPAAEADDLVRTVRHGIDALSITMLPHLVLDDMEFYFSRCARAVRARERDNR